MFMTFRCSREEDGRMDYVETTQRHHQVKENSSGSACVACRKKKLGCSREKDGCRRCRVRGDVCVYETQHMRGRKSQAGDSLSRKNFQQASLDLNEMENVSPPVQQDRILARGASRTASDQASQSRNQTSIDTQHSPQTSIHDFSEIPDAVNSTMSPAPNDRISDKPQLDIEDDYLAQMLELDDGLFAQELAGISNSNLSPAEDADTHTSQSSYFNPPFNAKLQFQRISVDPPSARTSGSSSDNDDFGDMDVCECTTTALQMLEAVVVSSNGNDGNSMEEKLYLLKHHISQCGDLSQCIGCLQDSGFAMLLLLVYQKLQATLAVLTGWCKKSLEKPERSRLQQPSQAAGFVSSNSKSRDMTGIMRATAQKALSMGSYKIDTMEERHHVLVALIRIQLQRLSVLIT
ncbi:fungal zn(2)-Cys(6) binuclear cluster domain-containing protein [Pochonia chlamydosporia 170]|uniref:Fungal zn(2)-Cys(6) binuclear cluster domain-containing protein n=1 Tax=Pochonia chlamydosporia 170 TaxID=1380566 RepID=A0A179EZV1_METCM|nr:fungal zn(2)-Cys(6) binuclear cluster domain-containing protein [Pochonia chlamydosporia 170]OAQ58688.1 fungal zn(2)-Cys(6) binuclear cluster domain-containing protein [Pochonia chlamydosporia 170]